MLSRIMMGQWQALLRCVCVSVCVCGADDRVPVAVAASISGRHCPIQQLTPQFTFLLS